MKPITPHRALIAGLTLWGILATASCCIVQSRAATIDDGDASAAEQVVHAPRATQPTGNARMHADCEGGLQGVLLRVDSREPDLFAPTHAALARALLPDCDVHVLHDELEGFVPLQADLLKIAPRMRDGLHLHALGSPGSAWLRDVITAAEGPDGAVWLLHAELHYRLMAVRAGGADARAVISAVDAPTMQTSLGIDGGEMVCDGERVLVSESAARRARRAGTAESDAAFLAQVEQAYGHAAVLVRNRGTDTWGHCDLVVATAARRTLVVGSPTLARRILRDTPAEDVAAFERRLAETAATARKLPPLPAYLREGGVAKRLETSSNRATRLTAFARMRGALRDDGFELVEIPFLSLDPRADGTRIVLSYTNVVLDAAPDRKRAYVPQYGLATLDQAALDTWRRLGWTPVGIDCLGPALAGGGLRCLTQVVRSAGNP